MAISGTLEKATWASNRSILRTEVPVDLNVTGTGSTEVILNGVFANVPDMQVVPPLGGLNSYYSGYQGVVQYQAQYDPAVPKITVSVDAESNPQLQDKKITVLLLAADRV